jgi:hypothetical protein
MVCTDDGFRLRLNPSCGLSNLDKVPELEALDRAADDTKSEALPSLAGRSRTKQAAMPLGLPTGLFAENLKLPVHPW